MGELAAICGEEEFAELIDEMVSDEAPRLFAVVAEVGERVDGEIAGWGLAFADHTVVMCGGGRSWLNVRSPERACRLLSHAPDVSARLVWVDPPAAR